MVIACDGSDTPLPLLFRTEGVHLFNLLFTHVGHGYCAHYKYCYTIIESILLYYWTRNNLFRVPKQSLKEIQELVLRRTKYVSVEANSYQWRHIASLESL